MTAKKSSTRSRTSTPAAKKVPSRRSSQSTHTHEGDTQEEGARGDTHEGASQREETSGEIGRAHILNRYWELANLDPEITKGTITGQLKALDSLCEELGLAPAHASEAKDAGIAKEAPAIYRSAWIRTIGRSRESE